MDPFAEASDVADLWRPLKPNEQHVAENLCIQASVMLRTRIPDLDQRLADGKLDPALPRQAVVAMVKRSLRNRNGVRSRSSTTGPFSESETYADGDLGELEVTAHELKLLRRTGTRRKPAGTIRLKAGLW